MKDMRKNEAALLISIPLLFGLIIILMNSFALGLAAILYYPIIIVWEAAFGVLWFWCGRRFARNGTNKIKSFILGNSLWAASFILYIWQFLILGSESRMILPASIAQLYHFGMTWISSSIVGLFTNQIMSVDVISLAYILMFIIFSAGFIYETKINSKNHKQSI